MRIGYPRVILEPEPKLWVCVLCLGLGVFFTVLGDWVLKKFFKNSGFFGYYPKCLRNQNFKWTKLLSKTTKTIKIWSRLQINIMINIPAFCIDISSIFWHFIRYARNRFKIRASPKPSKLRFHQIVGHSFVKITVKFSLFKIGQQTCFPFFVSSFEAFKCFFQKWTWN